MLVALKLNFFILSFKKKNDKRRNTGNLEMG